MSSSSPIEGQQFEAELKRVTQHVLDRYQNLSTLPILPSTSAISSTISSLPSNLPKTGLGIGGTTSYLINEILPGCLQAQNGPRFFGFVTGGVAPAAQLADILVGSYDENVQVTLPRDTAATAVESRALELVLDLLDIPRENYAGRTITTGATSANVLGLACARDQLYSVSPHLPQDYSYAQDGPPTGPGLPSPPIIILALHPHFSITKAAGLVGLGAGPRIVQMMPATEDDELSFSLCALEKRLKEEKEVGRGVIVCYGLGEVNTGGFGSGLDIVAQLCRSYGAWLHVDAAFGGFAAVLPELRHLTKGIEQADSLTLDADDGSQMVPYDCGLFFTRRQSSLTRVFAPPTAPAYLSSSTNQSSFVERDPGRVVHDAVPSPLYCNIENSRRFRALPLLAGLVSLGKDGYEEIIRRNVDFAQNVARYIQDSPSYDLLNSSPSPSPSSRIIPLNIVLFRGSSGSRFPPTNPNSSAALTESINSINKMYVTATKWRGEGAVRLAVSNWRTGMFREDFEIVKAVLEECMVRD